MYFAKYNIGTQHAVYSLLKQAVYQNLLRKVKVHNFNLMPYGDKGVCDTAGQAQAGLGMHFS